MTRRSTLVNTTALTPAPAADTGAAQLEEADTKRKIANRDWIDASGKEVDEEQATGMRYEFLGRTKDGVTVPPDGKSFSAQWAELTPFAQRLYGLFGMQTLWGNVVNTWLGDKSEDRAAYAADAIADRHALMNDPDATKAKWIDRTRDGVGARVDQPTLARSIVNVAVTMGKVANDPATIEAAVADRLAKLTADPDYAKGIRQIPQIGAEYTRLMGRTVKSIDDAFAGL